MNDCFYSGLQPNLYPKNKSSIVSSGNITESDKAASANELIDNNAVYNKSGIVGPSLEQNYNDTYNNASQVDNKNTMIARNSEVKAVSAINSDTNKKISFHGKKETVTNKKDIALKDCSIIGLQPIIYPINKSSIVLSDNKTDSDKSVSANVNTMIAYNSKVKAVSAINCDKNKKIPIHEEKNETETNKKDKAVNDCFYSGLQPNIHPEKNFIFIELQHNR